MLVVSELAEAVEADRIGKRADRGMFEKIMGDGVPAMEAFRVCIKNSIEDELADAVIRLADMAEGKHLDFPQWDVIEHSMATFGPWGLDMSFCENCWNIVRMLGGLDTIKVRIPQAVFQIEYLASVMLGIDLLWHIDMKLRFNNGREFMHSKRY